MSDISATMPLSAAVILAAGKSTRMKSRLPKPLHPVCGLPLSQHVVEACRGAGVSRTVVVVGHEAEAVKEGLGADGEYALQVQQRGTGDAVSAAEPALADFRGTVLVCAGDVPLLRAETLRRLLEHHNATGAAATLLTAILDDATGYGRIVRNADGTVARIVEHKDATPEERQIKEWNPSIYCFNSEALFTALHDVKPNNAQGEYYLTDVIGLLNAQNLRIEAVPCEDADEVRGVNTRVELAEIATLMRKRILNSLMLSGVSITDPANTYIDAGVQIGQDTTIEPNTYLHGATVIGEGCTIGPLTRVLDSRIGDNTKIVSSQVVESEVGSNVKIGPFAHLRPKSRLADGVKIGDFVETKNAVIGPKVSISHLAYIGDAEVGEGANIGAGVVTCNYDGVNKHKTTIGKRAFVGTHATLVAPVTIGDGAYVAAGSPITEDVPEDALAIARSRATVKPEWARKKRESQSKS